MDAREFAKSLGKTGKQAIAARKQKRSDEAFARGQREAEASHIVRWNSFSDDKGACCNPFPSDDPRNAAYRAGWESQP